jgi:hypothetical protein
MAILPAIVSRKEKDPSCWLQLAADGINESSTGMDYFESVTIIRRRLAKRGIFPLCYAASRNVWPSGMARDMAEGLAAYKLKMGSPGEERVHIFDQGPDVDPVTPEEQKAFSEVWLKSLK